MFAVAGNNISGVAVQQMIKSISSGLMAFLESNPWTASTPKSEEAKESSCNHRRSRIPDRE
jgi:hypothetical protein